jgi:hypothetical protein
MPCNIFGILKYRLLQQISNTKLDAKLIHMNTDKVIKFLQIQCNKPKIMICNTARLYEMLLTVIMNVEHKNQVRIW